MDRWWFWSFNRGRWEESTLGGDANTSWGRISTYGVTVYASEDTRDGFRDGVIQGAVPYGNPEGRRMEFTTPPKRIHIGETGIPATSVEGPRIAEAECDKCGYRMSYYPEDGPIPYGWGFISKVHPKGGIPMAPESLGVCQDCLTAVREGRDKGWRAYK